MSRYARHAAVRTMGADRNAGPLKEFAEWCGLSVEPLPGGNGRPDWLVGGWGVDALAEVKPERSTEDEVFERETNLRKKQRDWHAAWRGGRPFVVRTCGDVLAMVNVMRKRAERMAR